jgi:hypothetical protein
MRAFLIATILLNAVCALQVSLPSKRKGTTLYFQVPNFGAKDEQKDENNDSSKREKKSIGLSGLIQVITAGMGAPFLGDFEGVEEETGKFMFSLEANNLVDEVTMLCFPRLLGFVESHIFIFIH